MRARSAITAVLLMTVLGLAAASPAAGSEHAEAAATDGPGLLPVGDIVTPVVSRGRLAGYVVVKASLEFENPLVAKSAEPWLPRIVDAWVRTMYGLSQRGHFGEGSVDPELLKKQLLQSAIGALKSTAPDDVLIVQALYTRAN
jgi:hypothetical protein